MYRYYKLISQGYLKNITVQKLELENFLNVKSSRIVINIQILKFFPILTFFYEKLIQQILIVN